MEERQDTQYTNQQLANDYLRTMNLMFLSSRSGKEARRIAEEIEGYRESILQYYQEHESLDELPLEIGSKNKKILELILMEGAEKAGQDLKDHLNRVIQMINSSPYI